MNCRWCSARLNGSANPFCCYKETILICHFMESIVACVCCFQLVEYCFVAWDSSETIKIQRRIDTTPTTWHPILVSDLSVNTKCVVVGRCHGLLEENFDRKALWSTFAETLQVSALIISAKQYLLCTVNRNRIARLTIWSEKDEQAVNYLAIWKQRYA